MLQWVHGQHELDILNFSLFFFFFFVGGDPKSGGKTWEDWEVNVLAWGSYVKFPNILWKCYEKNDFEVHTIFLLIRNEKNISQQFKNRQEYMNFRGSSVGAHGNSWREEKKEDAIIV